MSVKERLAEYDGFIDVGILRHGFAPHMRDYDVWFEAPWRGEGRGTHRLRFTHCTECSTTTSVPVEAWRLGWSDDFIDHERWRAAGEPDGFVWGACWSLAYPGLSYLDDSAPARQWSERFGKPMHEIVLETAAFHLRIVFHDFLVTKVSDEVRVVDKVVLPLDPEWRESDA